MKNFRLPKDFGIKWLEALRSGKFQQGTGKLVGAINAETYSYCCLGVAGFLACENNDRLFGGGFLRTNKFENVGLPTELLIPDGMSVIDHPMSNVLSQLNDGTASKSLLKDYVLRPEINVFGDSVDKMNFLQIADFIEDNTEFYETI